MTPRDWDAHLYDTISDMQLGWGEVVLERVELRGDERVLDAGCGTGKVTAAIAERLPRGSVIGVDASPSMIERARTRAAPNAEFLVSDLLELELDEPVDVAFSNATFHWIHDHDRLFRRIHDAVRPGGRLEAQLGGEGNVADVVAAIERAAAAEPFAAHLAGLPRPWRFPSGDETIATLERAGFVDVRCWTEELAQRFDEPRDLYACGLGHYLDRLPELLRDEFVTAVIEGMEDPTLREYVRLNISARRAE